MTHQTDGSICTYLGDRGALGMRAIGWLSYDHGFPVGHVPSSVLSRLQDLLRGEFSPWGYFGFHCCDICAEQRLDAFSAAIQEAGFLGRRVDAPGPVQQYPATGTANLVVPGDEEIYVCPEMILHYIADHGYAPPDDFCRAVLRCPPIPSVRYFHRLFELGGDEWVALISGLGEYERGPLATVGARAVRLWGSRWYRSLRRLTRAITHASSVRTPAA